MLRRIIQATTSMLAISLPILALASWSEPSCDPSADPTTCNVSAPINVSSINQTKSGGLTITGAFAANGVTTFGSTVTVNGGGITINAPLVVSSNMSVSGATTFSNAVSLNSTSSFKYGGSAAGFVLPIEPNEGIDDNEVSNTLTASIFKGTGSTSNAIDLATAEVAGTLPSGSVADIWVNTNTDTMTGTLNVTPSSAVDGIVITPNATRSGITISGSSSSPQISLNPTGSSNGLYVSPATTTTGYGVYVNSSTTNASAFPLYVNSSGSASRSIYGRNTTTNGYAVYGLATGTGGAGVGASSTNGHGVVGTSGNASYSGGYFYNTTPNSTSLLVTGATTGASSKGIDVTNTIGNGINVTASGGGAGIYVHATDMTTTGVEINAYNGNGLRVSSGAAGIDVNAGSNGITIDSGVNGINIEAANIGVNVDGPDTGVNVTNAEVAITSQAAYMGGQFYPYEATGQGTFNGSGIFEVENDGGGSYEPIALAHDEGQTYLVTDEDLIIFDPRNTEEVVAFAHSLTDPVDVIVRDDYVYIFNGTSSSYFRYHRTAGSTTSSTTGATAYPNAVATDGTSAWIGTDSTVQEWSSFSSISTRASGLGNIGDILVAGQYVYAASGSNGEVYKILRESPYTKTTINVGGIPNKMTYDGQYIWITDSARYGLIKLNTYDDSYTVYEDILSTESEGPNSLTFDGTYLWIGFFGLQVGKYHIPTNTLQEQEGLSAYSIFTPTNERVVDMMFDGTYVWAVNRTDDGGELTKISTGKGTSSGVPLIHNGIMMFDTDGDPYCLYLNSSGTVTTTTSTTNCL